MPSASFCRKLVLLLLLLAILAVPLASAAGPGRPLARPAEAFASLDLLGRLWSFLTSTWSATGCMIDPSGGCAPEPQPQGDTGCMIDPEVWLTGWAYDPRPGRPRAA